MSIKPVINAVLYSFSILSDIVLIGLSLAIFIPSLRDVYPDIENHVADAERKIKFHIYEMADTDYRARSAMAETVSALFDRARSTNPATRQEWRNARTEALKELNKQFPELFDIDVVTTVIQ